MVRALSNWLSAKKKSGKKKRDWIIKKNRPPSFIWSTNSRVILRCLRPRLLMSKILKVGQAFTLCLSRHQILYISEKSYLPFLLKCLIVKINRQNKRSPDYARKTNPWSCGTPQKKWSEQSLGGSTFRLWLSAIINLLLYVCTKPKISNIPKC